MAKKEKIINETEAFKEFRKVIKSLNNISRFIIKSGNLMFLYPKVIDTGKKMESFIILKNPILINYFDNIGLIPRLFLDELKEKEIKIKGVEVKENSEEMEIFLNGIKTLSFSKMSNYDMKRILNTEDTSNFFKDKSYTYNKLPSFIEDIVNKQFSDKWIKLNDYISDKLIIMNHPVSAIVSTTAFPLLKDNNLYIMKLLETESKTYIVFKEEYENYDIFSLMAVLNGGK